MSVTYKRIFRLNPLKKDGSGKYHPQLIIWGKSATLESLALQMKENSSLTLGDIQSVLTNFVSAMRTELYNGHSVNIDGFGVFSLSATTDGTDAKDKCQADKIRAVRINFRASSAIRPNLDTSTTRAETRIDFVDLESQLAKLNMKPSEDGGDGGGGSGNDGDLDENPMG
ncbi:HU family DNA-binding protein [Bacteroides sp.]|uniref:HU family DNA-binding protein n=1 Tax=Bacteroides sp. TaxID=29523 RepID=UPI003AB8AECB